MEQTEVAIIGAGPAGALAAALLRKQGRQVVVVERDQFPRFSVGESLLPQCMEYLEQADMLQAVVEGGFQHKNGAAFACGERFTDFDFREQYSKGWSTTYQVQRAPFDEILAREAARQGADVRFRHEVTAVDVDGEKPRISIKKADGESYELEAQFLLDASGFGRILQRLLKLEVPSNFPVRSAIVTHIEDGIPLAGYDRNKVRVMIHPEHSDVWYWLIPFSNGRASLGVVAEPEFLAQYQGTETERLQAVVAQDAGFSRLLADAKWDTPARQITGYSANVKSLSGNNYALLGNAGEFLDPVFSSGIAIAFRSAVMAAALLERRFAGETVDWQAEYGTPLKKGVDTFRAFVESWYAGGFQRIIFFEQQAPDIRRMVCSILAGYAWDESNPLVRDTKRRLAALEEFCSMA